MSSTPQFGKAEYSSSSAGATCNGCRQAISGAYYIVKNVAVCSNCAERLRSQLPQDTHSAFVRGVIFGAGGFVLGLTLYAGFTILTGIEIGFVSLAVGWLIGKAMRMGSGGIGGRRYQVVAALLTYAAVSMAFIPIAIHYAAGHTDQFSMRNLAIGKLAWMGLASPFLELTSGTSGIIGLIILFVGMRFAWRITADLRVPIEGPFQSATSIKA